MKMCLIGSTRFEELYKQANRELTLQGHVVYSCASFKNDGYANTDREKEVLDLVHLRKLEESEVAVLITDATFYFGDSTRRELLWCNILGTRGPVVRMYNRETRRAEWNHSKVLEEKFNEIYPKTSI